MKRWRAMEQLEQIQAEVSVREDELVDKGAAKVLEEAQLVMKDDHGYYILTNSGHEIMIAWSKLPEELPEYPSGKE